MKMLVVSSKYFPEYSGSGYRANNTYKRLKKRYAIDMTKATINIDKLMRRRIEWNIV